jgi:peroxiredoxin
MALQGDAMTNIHPLPRPWHKVTTAQDRHREGKLDTLPLLNALIPVGEYAPAFVLPRCDSGSLGFAELIGSLSIIHFYSSAVASWSVQSQSLNALAPTLGVLGVTLVGIICAHREVAARHCSEASADFPVLCDWEPIGLVSRLYGFNLTREAPHFPATYLVDSRGVIRWIGFGGPQAGVNSAEIIAAVRMHLARPSPVENCD